MEHSTEILYNRTRVYCSAVHRFGSDALLLARFSEPKRAWRAADLCSGCGIVSLEWHDRGHRGPCLGLELQPEASALLEKVAAWQAGNLPRQVAFADGLRQIGFGDMQSYPCGGTHVASLSELGKVVISQVKMKKGQIIVSYTVE